MQRTLPALARLDCPVPKETTADGSQRGWRSRGVAFAVTAAVLEGGAAAFGALGLGQLLRIKAGGFDTAADIAGAARAGTGFNQDALGMALVGVAVGLIAAPLILANPDPTPAAGACEGPR